MECCRPQKLPQEAQKKQKEPHKNILDNKGSSIDPYGTPNKMSIHQLKVLFSRTAFCLFLR